MRSSFKEYIIKQDYPLFDCHIFYEYNKIFIYYHVTVFVKSSCNGYDNLFFFFEK